MKKKLTALLLALTSFAAYQPTVFPEAEDMDIHLTFETENPGDTFDSLSGSYDYVKGSKLTDTAVSLGAYANNSARQSFGKEISDGVIKVSFDYKAETYNTQFYIRVFSPGDANVAETFCDKGGIFSYYPETVGWDIGDGRASYELNKWYQISYYINLDSHTVYYYCDGELYGFTRLKDAISKLSSIAVVNDNSMGSAVIDNFCLQELHTGDERIPEAVAERAYIEPSSDAHGRIFYQQEKIPLKLTIGNKQQTPSEYTLKYQISENGRFINETEEAVALEASEKKDIDILASTDGFGWYTLTAQLYDADGSKAGEAIPYCFSVASAIKEGEKNEALGIQLQSSGYSYNQVDFNADAHTMRRIGFSFTRGVFPGWERYEAERGVYNYDQWLQSGTQKVLDEGLEILPIMAFGNFRFGDEWLTPKTQETYEGYAQYVVHLLRDVQQYNGYVPEYIDIWNEYWMEGSGFNPGYGKAENYAEMLKITYQAVKAEFPDVKICGLSGFSVKDLEWVEDVLKAGGADYMDVITGHPYYNMELPDECRIVEDLQYVKDLFAEYGKPDMPMWLSEWGWPSVGENGYPDERQTASNFIRGHVILDETGLVEKYNWYSSNNVGNDNGQESRFGLLRGHYDKIADEAKPTFLAASHFIGRMTGAELQQSYRLGDNVRAFRYKLADGRDALVCWAVKEAECVGFKLNTSAVTLEDTYGNGETVNGIDGTFSFAVDIDPIYIIGNFSTCEPCESLFTLDTQDFGMVMGDRAELNLEKKISQSVDVAAVLPDNITTQTDMAFTGAKKQIILNSTVCDRTEEKIPLRLMLNDKCVFKAKLTATYNDPIDISLTARPYSSKQLDRWQINLKIDANYYDNSYDGEFIITGPDEIAQVTPSLKIPAISGGGSRTVKLNIPKKLNDEKIHLTGIVKIGEFNEVEIDEMITLRSCVFAKTPPKIDGVLDEGEWNRQSVMLMNDTKSYIKLSNTPPYAGLSDLSAKVYTAWDYDNFYLAAEVTDDSWNEMEGTELLWASDGIQFGIAPSKSTTQLTQVDIGKLHDEFQVLVEIATNPANQGLVEDADLQIRREGNVTTYELRMPWTEIFFDGFNVRKNSKIAFSMLINDNDGFGRKGYMENGSGLGSGFKIVGEFLDLFMVF